MAGSPRQNAFNRLGADTAGTLLFLGAVYIAATVSARQAVLFLIGGAAGLTLYHAGFGFTSSWRIFVSDRRGEGLRAQMLMLGVATAVFIPLLAAGSVFGTVVRGSVAPLGPVILVGAFLFGLGMQLGGGCASGTLYTAGGGNPRMVVTLAAFIAGSVLGTYHAGFWAGLPTWPAVSLLERLGPAGALVSSVALFGGIVWLTRVLERRRHGRLMESPLPEQSLGARLVRGPWPLAWGALGLALVNVATLLVAGRPWGVTSAFALWGAKALAALGVDVAAWPYWTDAARVKLLTAPVVTDVTSVMDFGIMIGAFGAAGLAGRLAPVWRIPFPSLMAATIGGLAMGYGARLAFGCNIGAFFSGVASTSLHGWLWFVAAFAGSIVGTALRPLFSLRVERSPRQPVQAAARA